MQHTWPILRSAEEAAAATGDVVAALNELRRLSLDDFGMFIISLPDENYPALSRTLPRMASPEIQEAWTGASGIELLKQTLAFTRILENCTVRHMKKDLRDATVLDFGCGYGRILRMLYYFTDPDCIWGVDAWDRSLTTSREACVLGHLVQSERVPSELPVGETKFDVAFAFSVFTHLAPTAADASLAAVRKHMKVGGIFLPTIRPVEFWSYIDQHRGTHRCEELIERHMATGVAYLPHDGSEGETYGDTSLAFDFFKKEGWTVVGYERSIFDVFQMAVILQAS